MKRKRKPNRRRTSKDVPAKSRLRDMADDLWSLAVKADWAGKCAVCGHGNIHAHHLIPREYQPTRYKLRNGIALCATHHIFDPNVSAHQNAAGWMLWLFEHHEELHDWYVTTDEFKKPFDGMLTPAYYCEQIQALKQYVDEDDYVRIVGQKFAAWLESQE